MLGRIEKKDIEELIEGCKKNNRKDQKILYDQYFESLYVHCQRYQLAEEESLSLINTTMLNVFQNIKSVHRPESLAGWIHIILKNQIFNHFRAKKNHRKYCNTDTELIDLYGQNSTDEINSAIEVDHIYQVLDQLSEIERKVVTMYAIDGFNYREISEKLNISESTSKWHMKKARAEISKRIDLNHD